MPHVSRRRLPKKTLEKILDSLILVFSRTGKKKEMAELMDALLSETERLMLAKRIAVIFLLSEGVKEGSIADALNVTPFTVSRLKLWYETKGFGYRVAIKELKKQKDIEFLKDLALKLTASFIKSARFVT